MLSRRASAATEYSPSPVPTNSYGLFVASSIEHERTIDSLTRELEANRDTMLYYRDLNRRLASDPALMEQVVREQYGMKRASEDVYVFTEE